MHVVSALRLGLEIDGNRVSLIRSGDMVMRCANFLWLLVLLACRVGAEMLPDYDPATLTRYSDLVVMGELGEQSRVTVREVLKGATDAKELVIPSLGEFVEEGGLWDLGKRVEVTLGREVLLFLDQRVSPPRVVGNGYFRAGKSEGRAGVFGYRQFMNPGPYGIDARPMWDSFATVTGQVKEECGKIPARQRALLEKVKAGIATKSFHSDLYELCSITRRGDMEMLKQVAELEVSYPEIDEGFLANFIREVMDPAALDLLIALDRRDGRYSMLQHAGGLGNARALEFFKSLLAEEKDVEAYQVLWGMRALYLACEERGDAKACERVREAIYAEMDKDLPNLLMMSPQLISVIPHEGSIERLERGYAHHEKLENNAAYEINLRLIECRKKMAAAKPAEDRSR